MTTPPLLLTIREAAETLRVSPAMLRSPATRARLGIDIAIVRLGRRTLVSYDVLREVVREIAGADAPIRKPAKTTA